MGNSLFGWINYATTSVLTAGSAATNLPVGNIASNSGAASTAWQTAFGATTLATGAWVTIAPYVPAHSWDVIGLFRTNLTSSANVTFTLCSIPPPTATNYLLSSGAVGSGSWSNSGLTVTPNAAVAPDGTTTASLLTETTANVSHYTYQAPPAVTVGQVWTFSIYLKASGSSTPIITNNGEGQTQFNLVAGTVTGGVGTITSVGNGWYRCAQTFTKTNTNGMCFLATSTSFGAFVGSTGTSILAWGAQWEQSPVATAYIPTTTVPVTRAFDVVWTTTLVGPTSGYGQVIALPPPGTIADYVTIAINDPTNPEGCINIPMVFAGSCWWPVGSVGYSTSMARTATTSEATTRGGQEFPALYYQRKSWRITLDAMRTDETWASADILNIFSASGGNVFFVPDVNSPYVQSEAIFGRLKGDEITYPYQGADRRRWTATITERL